MKEVVQEIKIGAPPGDVWRTLSNLGDLAKYDPAVLKSRYTSTATTGVGATRHCEIKGGFLDERVVEWKDGHSYTIEVVESKATPFKQCFAEFRVEPFRAGSRVTQKMKFSLKGGPLAPILGLVAPRFVKTLVGKSLEGLAQFVEKGASQSA